MTGKTQQERLDALLEDVPDMSPSMKARVEGNKAFGEGVKLEDGPKEFNADWRQGWKDARQWKVSAFHNYIRYRTLFDDEYCPPWARGSRSHMEQFQAQRKKKIDFFESRYPDFPAAYIKHLEWKKGK